jgi:hypothetical protein
MEDKGKSMVHVDCICIERWLPEDDHCAQPREAATVHDNKTAQIIKITSQKYTKWKITARFRESLVIKFSYPVNVIPLGFVTPPLRNPHYYYDWFMPLSKGFIKATPFNLLRLDNPK